MERKKRMTKMRSRWEQQGIPNPGSQAAQDRGCECPHYDNHKGQGFIMEGELVFWIAVGCPMHAPMEDTAPL
jgi:hypothetical protein